MAYLDVDGDGEKEIVVRTIIGSGMNLGVSELHILKVQRKKEFYEWIEYEVFSLTAEDVTAFFNKRLKSKRGKEADTIEFTFDKQTWTASLEPEFTWKEDEGVRVGTHLGFSIEDSDIQLWVYPFVKYEERTIPGWFGEFTADVIFDGKEIKLTNINFDQGY